MPPVVIDLRQTDDWRDVVHRAVQALVEGRLVAFPTETVYGLAASALDAKAVDQLLHVKGRQAGHPLTLAIKSADEAPRLRARHESSGPTSGAALLAGPHYPGRRRRPSG